MAVELGSFDVLFTYSTYFYIELYKYIFSSDVSSTWANDGVNGK